MNTFVANIAELSPNLISSDPNLICFYPLHPISISTYLLNLSLSLCCQLEYIGMIHSESKASTSANPAYTKKQI